MTRGHPRIRRTIVVHTKLAGHMARVNAARTGESGVQIMTMGQLAARLAGGLLRPVDPDALRDAVREALLTVAIGELEPIKNLPGMVRAAINTLDKVWRAGVDLSAGKFPRLQALHALEEEVLRRLPPSMKRPTELVEFACKRFAHAKAALGPVEIHGHSEMSPLSLSEIKSGRIDGANLRGVGLARYGQARDAGASLFSDRCVRASL
jgi:hypothetical protein